MRQILLNSRGAVVARVPRPVVDRGSVLVRVHYSLISVGTEIAPLRSVAAATPDSSSVERGVEYARLARHYLRASVQDPAKALDRIAKIARRQVQRFRPAQPVAVTPIVSVGGVSWTRAGERTEFTTDDAGVVRVVTDESAAGYQIMSQAI